MAVRLADGGATYQYAICIHDWFEKDCRFLLFCSQSSLRGKAKNFYVMCLHPIEEEVNDSNHIERLNLMMALLLRLKKHILEILPACSGNALLAAWWYGLSVKLVIEKPWVDRSELCNVCGMAERN